MEGFDNPETCACTRVATKILRRFWEGFVKDLLQREDHLIHNYAATFGVNNRPIYKVKCSFLVWVWPLDTRSRPSVVDD